MYVAFDDTDSRHWMCTTFLATEIVRTLSEYDLIGLPRLVRLNPAVPWKTRGNGALCLRFGKGVGERRLIGEIGDKKVFSYARSNDEPTMDEMLPPCMAELEKWSQLDDSDPGLVLASVPPSDDLYRRAVTRIITLDEAKSYLAVVGAKAIGLNKGRGIIGAAAAIAWRPLDRTYEVLTYRQERLWGTERDVSDKDVEQLDARFPSTFNNYDAAADRPAIKPHTTCPILYGVRGDSAWDLLSAKDSISSEKVDRWLLFITNQGTDDHIVHDWTELEPFSSYDIVGRVLTMPRTIEGGHVIFRMITERNSISLECAAYEPSKGFRDIIRALRPGDKIRTFGELRDIPRTLNMEKLEVICLARSMIKVSNPRCEVCGKRMRSIGRDQGYRCLDCGTRTKEAVMEEEKRDIRPGWYEPPVCARRHLAKPLKRSLQNIDNGRVA